MIYDPKNICPATVLTKGGKKAFGLKDVEGARVVRKWLEQQEKKNYLVYRKYFVWGRKTIVFPTSLFPSLTDKVPSQTMILELVSGDSLEFLPKQEFARTLSCVNTWGV
jgi:hypothetical protein